MDYVALAMQLVQLGAEIEPLAAEVFAAVSKPGGPTADDWTALRTREDALRTRLDTDPGAPELLSKGL